MVSRSRMVGFLALYGFIGAWLAAAAPVIAKPIPDWLLGDWTPVDVRQNADMIYPVKEDEPKNWLPDQHLLITSDSLTLADDRCEIPMLSFHRAPLDVMLRRMGVSLSKSYGLPTSKKVVDYIFIDCTRDLMKHRDKADFRGAYSRTTLFPWYVVVRSHGQIELPFFAGSYIIFRKSSPTS